jgi:hypothetical protein
MKTIICMTTYLVAATIVVLPVSGQDKSATPKRIETGKNVVLEIPTEGPRRVRVAAEVSFREGPIELLLCRKNTKEHEAILAADVDARHIHTALLAAGAKPGSPVKFAPKYAPASGTKIRVSLEYSKDGKTVIAPARQWVRELKTRKELSTDWVFGGSQFFPDPHDAKQPPLYAANGGDIVCVSNFESAMLDLPVPSTQLDADLPYEAFSERIPPLGTKVTVILEPVVEKR